MAIELEIEVAGQVVDIVFDDDLEHVPDHDHPRGLEQPVVIPVRVTLGEDVGDPIVLPDTHRRERRVEKCGIPPLQARRIHAGPALRFSGLMEAVLQPQPQPLAGRGRVRFRHILADIAQVQEFGPDRAVRKRQAWQIAALQPHPSADPLPQRKGSALIEPVDLARIDFVIGSVASPVDRIGSQETVGKPLRKEAEQSRSLLAGRELALPPQEDGAHHLLGRGEARGIVLGSRREMPAGIAAVGKARPADISRGREWRRCDRRCARDRGGSMGRQRLRGRSGRSLQRRAHVHARPERKGVRTAPALRPDGEVDLQSLR
jgi:hypothetical protein